MIDRMGGYEALYRPKRGGGYRAVKCAGCGKFIGLDQFDESRCEYEPLSEYGPEKIEWLCPRCVEGHRP